ncbi:integrase core domain-containing protein [Hymenobacter defluvii]|uniref:integrase core domain-containing protein n=1 Tax=Hymenobacter defluvii TaxID=2054411 RepID=UPI003D7695DC
MKKRAPWVGSFRHELLDAYPFRSLAHVRQLVAVLLLDYNTQRPPQALDIMNSLEFKHSAYPLLTE